MFQVLNIYQGLSKTNRHQDVGKSGGFQSDGTSNHRWIVSWIFSTPKMDDFGGATQAARPEKSAGCAKKGEATGSVCNWKSPAIGSEFGTFSHGVKTCVSTPSDPRVNHHFPFKTW